ncbi:MAG: hypothetical protein ACRDF9_12235, partial [Candidatus Limnocylindria bacterium]
LAQHTVTDRDTVLTFLADRQAASVREVIGIVHRVVAAADVAGSPLTVEIARSELLPGAPIPAVPEVRAGDSFFLDDEKLVWHLPDVGARLIEDPK